MPERKSLLLYPFLFALYPVLFLVSHNIEQALSLKEILAVMGASLLVTAVFLSCSWLLFRNIHKAGLLTVVAVVLFFSYGHLYELLEDAAISGFKFGRQRYMLALWLGLFVLSAGVIFRLRRVSASASFFLNIVSATLIFLSAFNIASFEIKSRWFGKNTHDIPRINTLGNFESPGLRPSPDIYYIILDAYANASTLKDKYGFDNSSFLNALENKGFRVIGDSRSNYSRSNLSIPSSLNMEYVHELDSEALLDPGHLRVIYRKAKNHNVGHYLKMYGYRYIHLRTPFSIVNYNPHADVNLLCKKGSEFLMIFFQTTLLNLFESRFDFMKDEARQGILTAFDKLESLERSRNPLFVFAHLFIPHPPYFFGPNGEVRNIDLKLTDNWKDRDLYLDQIRFANKKVLHLVEALLSKPGPKPVIVIQSDHGPDGLGMEERLKNLNVLYLPDGGVDKLYDGMTPVNTFRVILNTYVKGDFEILPDRSFYSDPDHPFRFTEIKS